uniref:Putative secreted protein n=1 Tax=Ixodes ricinus TaxID=34613 RepID=A0A6B0U9C4_IXORI
MFKVLSQLTLQAFLFTASAPKLVQFQSIVRDRFSCSIFYAWYAQATEKVRISFVGFRNAVRAGCVTLYNVVCAFSLLNHRSVVNF